MTQREYERYSYLAMVADLYYVQGLQQSEIAKRIGVHRSMVSRLVTEARERGVVKISINRWFLEDKKLQNALKQKYRLKDAGIIILPANIGENEGKVLLANFAAKMIYELLDSIQVLGLTLGSTLYNVIDALSKMPPLPFKCVQMVGSLGAAAAAFDGHDLVQKLSHAYGGEGTYFHAPFQVDSIQMRKQLFSSRSNSRCINLCKKIEVVLTGIGTLSPSALYAGGHITMHDLKTLRKSAVVGDVAGFDINEKGDLVEIESLVRMLGLSPAEFLKIPCRVGIAVGKNKVQSIVAALRGSWLTTLITDQQTALLL